MLRRGIFMCMALLATTAFAAEGKAKAVTLSNVHLAVTDAQGATVADKQIKYPTTLSEKPTLSKGGSLELSFAVSEPTAEQMFVRFTNEDKPYVKTFAASGPNAGLFVFKLDLSSKSSPKLPKGVYSMDVIVGGNAVQPLEWKAATLEVATPFEYKQPVDVELIPDLEYTFPPGPQKPPALLATIFSGAVLAPIAFLLAAWGLIGVNIKGFQPSLSALVFHGSVAAMFLLFVKFWIDTTMFEILYWAGPLTLVMFLSGNQALKNLNYGL